MDIVNNAAMMLEASRACVEHGATIPGAAWLAHRKNNGGGRIHGGKIQWMGQKMGGRKDL